MLLCTLMNTTLAVDVAPGGDRHATGASVVLAWSIMLNQAGGVNQKILARVRAWYESFDTVSETAASKMPFVDMSSHVSPQLSAFLRENLCASRHTSIKAQLDVVKYDSD